MDPSTPIPTPGPETSSAASAAKPQATPTLSPAPPPPPSKTPPELDPEPEEEPAIRAEKIKEQGNVAFKAKRYADAIDLYTKAIGMQLLLYFHPTNLKDNQCPFQEYTLSPPI
jgi:hypothetical protein